MRICELNTNKVINNIKRIAILSPHLDDGVLSCGDYVVKNIEEGHEVTIITVFSGYPNKEELSMAAKIYHSNCFLSHDSMEYRKKEDEQACSFLGCQYIHLNYYECLYRKNKDGKNIYPDLSKIYHLNKYDMESAEKLIDEINKILLVYDEVVAPLGLGKHADHLLLFNIIYSMALKNANKFKFYEEIPYSCYMYKAKKEIYIDNMESEIVDISEEQWKKKVNAILFYRSQLHIMWKNEFERIEQLSYVSTLHKGKGHCLRLWKIMEK